MNRQAYPTGFPVLAGYGLSANPNYYNPNIHRLVSPNPKISIPAASLLSRILIDLTDTKTPLRKPQVAISNPATWLKANFDLDLQQLQNQVLMSAVAPPVTSPAPLEAGLDLVVQPALAPPTTSRKKRSLKEVVELSIDALDSQVPDPKQHFKRKKQRDFFSEDCGRIPVLKAKFLRTKELDLLCGLPVDD